MSALPKCSKCNACSASCMLTLPFLFSPHLPRRTLGDAALRAFIPVKDGALGAERTDDVPTAEHSVPRKYNHRYDLCNNVTVTVAMMTLKLRLLRR